MCVLCLTSSFVRMYNPWMRKVSQATAGGVPQGPTGGKSELHRAGCRLTAGGGDPKASATEMQTADGSARRALHRQGCNGAVRAHQQHADMLARSTPPGARPSRAAAR